MRLPAIILLCATTAAASAHTVYKCTADGKPSYSDTPCKSGAGTVIAVPAAPASDHSAELLKEQGLSEKLGRERQKREAQDDRERQRAAKADDAQRKKCDKARLKLKWAQDDAKNASLKTTEQAHTKASRAADTAALECPK
ncbi:DUF4124 domain-containing protein [Rugamonas sp.]|uniref:DUF4124 domain-containing protein n=1 Tax=Rugamonas sp. TaxID=1926287 RepID=UPI0025ECA3B7|nr:DUF4124 domain-containing protein [Rugamonas sp.]